MIKTIKKLQKVIDKVRNERQSDQYKGYLISRFCKITKKKIKITR